MWIENHIISCENFQTLNLRYVTQNERLSCENLWNVHPKAPAFHWDGVHTWGTSNEDKEKWKQLIAKARHGLNIANRDLCMKVEMAKEIRTLQAVTNSNQLWKRPTTKLLFSLLWQSFLRKWWLMKKRCAPTMSTISMIAIMRIRLSQRTGKNKRW